jgi:hypothetical protein
VGGSEPADEFEFDAYINFISGGGGANCSSVTNGVFPPSGDYTCPAEWSRVNDEHHALVILQFLPAKSSSAG